MTSLSVLDLATVTSGSSPAVALRETIEVAKYVEQLGYKRLWVAEHHAMPAVASSAPAVLIAHLASVTSTLRVGAGGVMLPNHSPLVIAEQFATLEALHEGRIDLGLGRAPGTDAVTARALRRSADLRADSFPDDVVELIGYLLPRGADTPASLATPGSGYLPEVWILGSSTYGAQLAGVLGLPFSFAYHFAPEQLDNALLLYHQNFQPSIFLSHPRVMVCVSVICANDDDEASWLAGPARLSVLQRRSGQRAPLTSPHEANAYEFSPEEQEAVDQTMSTHLIGNPETVHAGLLALAGRTGADEIMLSTRTHSLESRVQSHSLIAGKWGSNSSAECE